MKLKCFLWKRPVTRWATLWVLVAGVWGGVAAAPGTKTESNTAADSDVPKSVFIDDARTTRDPFFPRSTRRHPIPPPQITEPEKGTGTIPIPPPPPVQLTLRAILVGQEKRLAQINNRNFAVGEEWEVLAGTQKVKIRCLEIRESSVLVSVEGVTEPRELSLRKP
jgi:hypothetical protein